MARTLTVAALCLLTLSLVYVVAADEPLTLENRVATLEALHGIDRSTPTATGTPQSTATATNTATPVTPSATSTATAGQITDAWHAPTNHEHGDAPPAWANAWSQAEFGHPIIYGGDESTPGENVHKHEAYKGFSFTKEGVQIYIRLHFQSNPHGRCTEWHSYEVYALDQAQNVSHWQGWIPVGEDVIGGGANAANPHALAGNAHFIAGASIVGQAEQWYVGQKYDAASWSWDFVWQINDPTTLYRPGECDDPMNMATWETTGAMGVSRSIVHAMYYIDNGAGRYPWRNNPGIRGWFCATPQGTITSQGSKNCGAGSLPQHVAVTMPALESVQIPYVARQYSCPTCELPN